MWSITIRSIARTLAPFAAVLLAGCFSFTTGVEEPDLQGEATAFDATLRIGETKRPQVHELLGEPLFSSDTWGVEFYRRNQSDLSTEWLVVLMVPVPAWTQTRDYRLYPLVVYDPSGVVRGFDTGHYAEHYREEVGLKSPESADAQALGFTLVVQPCPQPACLWLLAPADMSAVILTESSAVDRCTINIAKPPNGTRILLDGREMLATSGTVSFMSDSMPAEPWFIQIAVPPGQHVLKVASALALAAAGELTSVMSCNAAERKFITVDREFQRPERAFGRSRLTGTIEIHDAPPDVPEGWRLILFGNGRSWVPAGALNHATNPAREDMP